MMLRLFKSFVSRISILTILVGFGGAGCSHRNIKEKGPSRPRHLVSAASTEQYLFVVTNKNEFYRTDLNLRNFEALALPDRSADSVLSPILHAAGRHLYLMARGLSYSSDEGRTWQSLSMPKPGLDHACFDVDVEGQRLLAYGDSLWYARTPDEEFGSLGIAGVVDCRVLGSVFVIARGGVTEVRSLAQPQEVITSIPGYWLMQKSGDGLALLIVSQAEQKIYRYQPSGPLTALDLPFPTDTILSLAAYGAKVAILTSKQVLVYEGNQRTFEGLSSEEERFALMNAQHVVMAHDQGLETLRADGGKDLLPLP